MVDAPFAGSPFITAPLAQVGMPGKGVSFMSDGFMAVIFVSACCARAGSAAVRTAIAAKMLCKIRAFILAPLGERTLEGARNLSLCDCLVRAPEVPGEVPELRQAVLHVQHRTLVVDVQHR